MTMNRSQIQALDRSGLKKLLDNAKKQNSPKAREIEQMVRDELASRKTPNHKMGVKWDTPSNTRLDGYFDGRMVATITKVANHSHDQRDVYHLTINDTVIGYFEYIRIAKQRVEDVIVRVPGEGDRHE